MALYGESRQKFLLKTKISTHQIPQATVYTIAVVDVLLYRRVEKESCLKSYESQCAVPRARAYSRNLEGEIIALGLEEVRNRGRGGMAGRWLEQY